jgi:hypothetical protein
VPFKGKFLAKEALFHQQLWLTPVILTYTKIYLICKRRKNEPNPLKTAGMSGNCYCLSSAQPVLVSSPVGSLDVIFVLPTTFE